MSSSSAWQQGWPVGADDFLECAGGWVGRLEGAASRASCRAWRALAGAGVWPLWSCWASEVTEVEAAASKGHLSMVRWLTAECGWDLECVPRVVDFAAACGSVECLGYLRHRGCLWDGTTAVEAARSGNLECLHYLVLNHGLPVDETACCAAAQAGSLECLRFLHSRGCPWTSRVIACAAGAGKLDCLRFLHEAFVDWDVKTTLAAANHGYLGCLMYAHSHGCPGFDPECWVEVLLGAAGCPDRQCLEYVLTELRVRPENSCGQRIIAAAARTGSLENIRLLVSKLSCPLSSSIFSAAALGGDVEVLRYLRDRGCPWDAASICVDAARGGSAECLQYCFECLGQDPDPPRMSLEVGLAAVGSSSLPCLMYYFGKRKRKSDGMCTEAAKLKSPQCLAFLHEQGFPWNRNVCEIAARNDSLQCLKYAHEHGCPWNELTTEQAWKAGSLSCLVYARKRGCNLPGYSLEVGHSDNPQVGERFSLSRFRWR